PPAGADERHDYSAAAARGRGHQAPGRPRVADAVPVGSRRFAAEQLMAERLTAWRPTMKLALHLSYSGPRIELDLPKVLEAERLGYDSVWTAEAYGSGAGAPATRVAARAQRVAGGAAHMAVPARTPAMAAMTGMTLDQLSGGRFRMGLGVSGPQVVEGWHGESFGKPLSRTREYVALVRTILRREKPVEFRGEYYQVPYAGADATGLGKPLRSILHGRADIPIYLA